MLTLSDGTPAAFYISKVPNELDQLQNVGNLAETELPSGHVLRTIEGQRPLVYSLLTHRLCSSFSLFDF